MLAIFSAEPDAQDSVMNSQDTDRVIILTECVHIHGFYGGIRFRLQQEVKDYVSLVCGT